MKKSAHTLEGWRKIACELAAKGIKKDAEIERLNNLYRAALEELVEQGKLITELADALDEDEDFIKHQFAFTKDKIRDKFNELRKRAREAAKDE